ncbi:hypothetical protein PV326_002819 [Microctonus aethiopoides]|nr:hypothetical protein PV326_002819 [Microctonus aethiopoides]
MFSSVNRGNITIVFFDVETTGSQGENQIVEIGATSGNKSFKVYIKPTCEFDLYVSQMTGLTLKYNELYLNSDAVHAKSPENAIREFITFLKSVGSKVVLAAHGGSALDFPKISKLAKDCNMMKEFSSVVCGFIDTLPLLKSALKDRVTQGKKFTLEDLAEDYLDYYDKKGAHDALNDATVLGKIILCNEINLKKDEMLNSAVPINKFS